MWVDIRLAATIFVVASAALVGGCATVVKGTSQEISVTTDPAGAACELRMAGASLGSIGSTPGTLQVKKGQGNIEVFCKKAGYADASGIVSSSLEGWTFGNILLGGVIGVVVDASSGALHEYQSEIYVKLTPDKFASQEDRESFLDEWHSDILRNSAKAKIAASKQCSQQQCDEMLQRIDQETERALAAVEINRNLGNKGTTAAPPATQSPSSTSQPSAAASVPADAMREQRPEWMPKLGDRWTYQLLHERRKSGRVTIEIVEARDNIVKERITFDRSKGFFAERQVEVGFKAVRFQPLQLLPGGYQMAELAPYVAPESQPNSGQGWSDIAAEYSVYGTGRRNLLTTARAVGHEKVRVPAGEFDAWKIQTVSESTTYAGGPISIKCTFWYSPAMRRAVKMNVLTDSTISVVSTNETYELVSFEGAK